MERKKACLVINPRTGQNIAKLTDIIAVLSAAGWSMDTALKEYGGHTIGLAAKAAEKEYDLVIAYGGDGTLNQVVNGVMNIKNQHSIVGLIPGGTANVWAGEIGVPDDPVQAALSLVGSTVHKVDIGHVEVQGLALTEGDGTIDDHQANSHKNDKKAIKARANDKARHHFLLMAGLGIDAAIMSHVSKPLKYRIGPLAVGVSAAKELPKQQPFPIEIRSASGIREGELLWKGEALQVVIGNTRKYADIVEMTPNAYIDDGVLDVCVITAGDPLTTMQQITSLLLRRKPDNTSAEYFHGAHLSITAPASIQMQLDGSAVKLKDYLSKADRKALAAVRDGEEVKVTYRFDAMPKALQVAIPAMYKDTLFEHGEGTSHAEPALSSGVEVQTTPNESQSQTDEATSQTTMQNEQHELPEHIAQLKENGRKVSIVGVSHYQDKKGQIYIIAGGTSKKSSGETKPVAVRITSDTAILRDSGECVAPSMIEKLPEGTEIVVEGKKSKRGVIAAQKVLVE